MNNEQTIDPDALRNPSDGIIARNPTRLSITANSDDQQEIVDNVMGNNNNMTDILVLDYSNIDKSDPLPLSGITKIREMNEKQLIGFFKSLMRYKPNIIKLHLKLGEYPNKARVNNSRTALVNSNKQRMHTEVAERIAAVFDDQNANVVEILYTVNNRDQNYFSAQAEIYGVSSEDYDNDKFFAPAIGIEHNRVH